MLALIILSSFVAALIGVSGPLAIICNIVPSHPAFDGIMALSAGSLGTAVKDVGILAIHCVAWSAQRQKRKTAAGQTVLLCSKLFPVVVLIIQSRRFVFAGGM